MVVDAASAQCHKIEVALLPSDGNAVEVDTSANLSIGIKGPLRVPLPRPVGSLRTDVRSLGRRVQISGCDCPS